MRDEDKQLTEEEYANSSNKISMAMLQVGVDFQEMKDKLSTFIIGECSSFVEEDAKNDKLQKIYGEIFGAQIETYLNGCSYFLNVFVQYCSDNLIEVELVDVDEVNTLNDESQEAIIDSTTRFLQVISERFDNPNALDSDDLSFEKRISEVVSLYIDTSFIMGLTDAQSLNYFRNKSESVRFGGLTKLMEAIFSKVF